MSTIAAAAFIVAATFVGVWAFYKLLDGVLLQVDRRRAARRARQRDYWTCGRCGQVNNGLASACRHCVALRP